MAAGRASEPTRERLALALVVFVLGAGCREPAGADASSSASSSSDDGASATTEQPVPGRVPPEPFVLPEGCGDGVPVSGQYDCHYPVSLEYLHEAMGTRQPPTKFVTWDMDGDGRDELLAQAPGFESLSNGLAPLRWNGERFDVGKPVGGKISILDWTTRFDLDGDGRQDLVKFTDQHIAHHLTRADFELGDEQIVAYFDVNNFGNAAPLDLDGDGQLEALIVRWPNTTENPFPPKELWLHRIEGLFWSPVGQPLPLPACQWPFVFAWADFNADGHDDIAVLDHPTACDDLPSAYDPSWHAIAIFLTDPMTQTLVPGPVIPAGGVTHKGLFMLEDFDGDGDLDFLVGIGHPTSFAEIGAALVRGRGDGTFEDGEPIELPGIPNWVLKGRGDLDGDGDVDWILEGDAVIDDIFAAEPEVVRVRSEVIGIDGAPWANTRAFGDYNGDGVVDYVGGKKHAATGRFEMFVMISSP
jgi:hypothetical protein